jgi:hypothetical protein
VRIPCRAVTARELLLTLWNQALVRAAVCHGFGEPLAVEDVELRRPAAGEVGVRVAACGICHSDLSFIAWLAGAQHAVSALDV